MLEIHLRQTPFTYSACAKFTKNKKIIQKFKERGYSRYIYFNKINKACCQHDMAQGDFKGLHKRTGSDKVLHDKAFDVGKNPKYDEYQCGLTSMVYKLFDKKSTGASTHAWIEINFENQLLAEKLQKPIIRKFENCKVYSSFKDNI